MHLRVGGVDSVPLQRGLREVRRDQRRIVVEEETGQGEHRGVGCLDQGVDGLVQTGLAGGGIETD